MVSTPNVEIDLSPDQDGGILKTIVKEGTGKDTPVYGDVVHVHYVGKLESGEEFDSSGKNEFSFPLGEGQVIKGWDIGVKSMKLNEVAILKIAPNYAYGPAGRPPKIPANSTLIFEIELVRWTGEDISPEADGSIYKNVIEPGEKFKTPSEYAKVKVHAVGYHKGRKFYDRELHFELGEGTVQGLPDGVDKALRRFRKGEKAKVTLKSPWNYGSNPPEEHNLPPNAEVEFELFLKDYEETKHLWELNEKEKLDEALKLKARGTVFYNEDNNKVALDKWKSALNIVDFDRNISEEMKKEWRPVRLACHGNCAMAQLKLKEPLEVIHHCKKIIDEDPTNVKAHYRLGEANLMRKYYDEAIEYYKKTLELEPDNKAAAQQIAVCESHIQAEMKKEKKRFAALFKNSAAQEKDVQEPMEAEAAVAE